MAPSNPLPDTLRTQASSSADRRRWLAGAAAGVLACAGARGQPGRAAAASAPAQAAGPDRVPMDKRPIPSTRELLPVIGCGTWVGFDQEPGSEAYRRLPGVLAALFAAGGSVVDSSPMYGRAEATLGELLADAEAAANAKAFVATKVWTRSRAAGVRQMEASMQALRVRRVDLMQVHNLLDWREHLATLRDWKAAGRIRYIGVTHYTPAAYAELEAVLRQQRGIDFVQLNYAADDRQAEQRLLPLAAERGVAVLVNQPFGGGGLLRRLSGQPLPAWAADLGATGWPQLLLKFVLSHPAVTCAIPGTSRPEHMAANASAGSGPLPDRGWWTPRLAALGLA